MDSMVAAILENLKIHHKDFRDAVNTTNLAIEKLYYYNIKCVTIYDDEYPLALKKISDAPPLLFYKGNLKNYRMSAVVGSREISRHAQKITYQVVDWLNELNIGIVSGLALGIDTYAHERAVQNNQYTIAVLPNSLDSIYPLSNFKLANEILKKGGCLISELPFGINRGNKSFVQRNRLQSALSEAVIPIEMGIKSGTMHTVDFGKRYGKKIALFKPTPMLSNLPNYQGILHLLDKPHKNQSVFVDKESFFEIFKTEITENKLNL
jgi:DNA processing protein